MKRIPKTLAVSTALGLLATTLPVSAAPNIIHQWSFNEVSGTTAVDSVGGQNGTLMQTITNGSPQGALPTFDGSKVTLDGVGGYVDLGNGIFSGLSNVTVEVWFNFYDDTESWVNLLCAGAINDTGDAGAGGVLEDTVGNLRGGQYWGADGLFFTPRSGAGGNPARFAISRDTNATFNLEIPQLESQAPLDNDTTLGGFPNYVAITYGPDGQRLFNFQLEQESATVQPPDFINLSEINDINIWLGRSLYGGDPMLGAAIDELRIHDTILSGPEIAASYFATFSDPNIISYDPGALSALDGSATIKPTMSQTESQPIRVNGTFANLGQITVGFLDLDYAFVDNTNALEVVGPNLLAKEDGSGTLFFGLNGVSNSVSIIVSTVAPELVHRYSFSETNGFNLEDSVGTADGTIVDLSGSGTVSGGGGHALGGGVLRTYGGGKDTSDYIDLPDGLFQSSSLSNVTLEFWLTPHSAQNWSRVFDFNSSTADTWFLSLTRGGNINQQRHAHDGGDFTGRDTSLATTLNQEYHYVVVYSGGRAAWYRDGALIDEVTGLTSTPMDLNDTNNWLGRSIWPDNTTDASWNEFRIWRNALLPLNIALNGAAGPNAIPPDPGALLSIDVVAEDIMIGDPATTPACLCGTFENISGVNLIPVGGSLQSSDPSVITVDANGNLTGVGTNGQSATISGTYFSESVTPLVVSIYAPTGLTMNVASPLVAGDLSVSAGLIADFPSSTLLNQDVTGFNGIVWSSTDSSVASVSATGQVTPNGPGTATISATYGGLTANSPVTVTMPGGHVAATLLHRYSFSEAADSTNVNDSVGSAHGVVVGLVPGSTNDNFNGTGQLEVSGQGASTAPASAYVNLPNGLISGLQSVTMEGWFTERNPNGNWERVFDFGMSSGNVDTNRVPVYEEDAVANPGRAYFFLARQGTGNNLRFAYKEEENSETGATTSGVLAANTYYHFAVVVDPANQGVASLYLNGERVAQTFTSLPLSVIDDRNNWLGRSQWGDTMFSGAYDEFRIWDGALLGADVLAAYAAGPNSVITPIEPTTPVTLTITEAGGSVTVSWTPAGGTLQSAASPLGPWSDVGTANPYVTAATGELYYRVALTP